MPSHIADDLLHTIALDAVAPDAATAAHLAACAACQAELTQIQQLAGELAIARRSQPSPAALTQYARHFSAVQQQGTRLSQIWQKLTAVLTWDSRQQLALQGVRSGAATSYRLLYDTPRAEVEILLEAGAPGWRLEGEIIARDPATPAIPALIQLLDASGIARAEAEAQPNGRFQVHDVAPGVYELIIAAPTGPAIAIPALEIT